MGIICVIVRFDAYANSNTIKTMLDKKTDVIKHSATVHVANSLSLVERKISNALLRQAYNELLTRPTHDISISNLSEIIGWSKGNADQEIKTALKALVETRVELNILGKDKKRDWGVTTLLAQAEIKNGMCTFAYSPMLQQLLYNPNIYARLDLQIQRNFSSKHALALWEFLTEVLCSSKKNELTTDWIQLGAFRKLLDVMEEYYDEFMKLNQKVIKKAVNEINQESDLLVIVNYQRVSRKVTAVSFTVKRKDYFQPSLPLGSPALPLIEEDIPKPTQEDAIKEQLLIRLREEFKVPTRTAQRLIKHNNAKAIEADLGYVKEAISKGKKINDVAAFTIKAIEEHYGESKELEHSYLNAASIQNNLKEKEKIKEATIKHPEWAAIRKVIKESTSEDTFQSWHSKLEYHEIENNTLFLTAPTKFVAQHIVNHFTADILSAAEQVGFPITAVEISTKKGRATANR